MRAFIKVRHGNVRKSSSSPTKGATEEKDYEAVSQSINESSTKMRGLNIDPVIISCNYHALQQFKFLYTTSHQIWSAVGLAVVVSIVASATATSSALETKK
ncbi:hypothetical protein [Terribacillus saccharophilus]|uniref:hypothetical protein n=1 Tax=Terribacillus saccharophilus TaxID=361277 RepID=UPI001140EF57|nr:hypothetical protein [Terribacillus saccharophilus]